MSSINYDFQANAVIYPPYPGTPLRRGSRGQNVATMQTYLNSIRSKYYPQLPLLVVDGLFGARTEQAVRTYQSIVGLNVDGVIGQQTWNSIVLKNNQGGGVNPPYPGVVLQRGSRGQNVLIMQQYLNSIRQRFYPTIPLIMTDGIFGVQTERAVREFQALTHLIVDGKIGQQTWNAIVLKYQQGGEVVNPPFPGTVLEVGSTGSDVARMQTYLNAIGDAFYPTLPKLTVDGIYGTATANVVKQYQLLNGLTVDGKIGESTWNSIVLKYNSISGGGERVWPGYDLTYGVTGDDVSYMQARLNQVARFYTAIVVDSVDGIFGSQTEESTRQFQLQFGLNPDGVIGENTWNRIVNVATNLNRNVYTRVTTAYGGNVLEVGSYGDQVRFVQSYLNRINSYNMYGWPSLTVDGNYGSGTQNNVIRFQLLKGLNADGKVGPNTWAAILAAFNSTLI